MRVFRDITIYLDRVDPEVLAANIEHRLKRGWVRAKEDKEEEMRKDLLPLSGPCFCFHSPEKGDRQGAQIFLVKKRDGNLYVSNIVPLRSGSLSYDQYNDILVEFHESFLEPACSELGSRVELTSNEQSIEQWISVESVRMLRTFSRAANRLVPHPLDQERWYIFLLNVHHEHQNLSVDRLERWFTEEEHWPEDRASELALEYEFAMELLDYQARQSS
jgi:hypothetical protein